MLVSPSPGITIVNRTPTFTWTSTADASSFTIQVSVEKSFERPMLSEEVDENSYTIAGGKLTHDKTYYWRVKANSGSKSTAWSEINTFKTIFLG